MPETPRKPVLNASWHVANPMPALATLDQRVRWHVAHARACGCRTMPATIAAEVARRGRTPTTRRPRRAVSSGR